MTEGIAIIDVWDVETFDSELRGERPAVSALSRHGWNWQIRRSR